MNAEDDPADEDFNPRDSSPDSVVHRSGKVHRLGTILEFLLHLSRKSCLYDN